MKTRLAVLLVVAGTLVACGVTSPSDIGDVGAIRATTSFGMCNGYCLTELEITPQGVVLVENGWGSEAPRQRSARLSSPEWAALVRVVDRQRLEAMPAVVGCPDCADGGAESLEVVGADWRKRVAFDFNAEMPELQPLLDQVRALRNRLES